MKKNFLPFIALSFIISSCNSGWTSAEKKEFMESCKKAEMLDCECAYEKTTQKYPRYEEFAKTKGNDMDLAKELVNDCLKK
ncbi:MAG: hypothetical protein ACOZCO_03485 [Bacteroidota bacterium]